MVAPRISMTADLVVQQPAVEARSWLEVCLLERACGPGLLRIVQRLVACVHEDRVHAEHLCLGLGARVAAGGGRRRRGLVTGGVDATPALPCVSVGSVAAPSEAQPATSSTSAARPPAARARPRRTAPADEQRGDVADGRTRSTPLPWSAAAPSHQRRSVAGSCTPPPPTAEPAPEDLWTELQTGDQGPSQRRRIPTRARANQQPVEHCPERPSLHVRPNALSGFRECVHVNASSGYWRAPHMGRGRDRFH